MKWWYWGLGVILALGAAALVYFLWGKDYFYNKRLMTGVNDLVVFQYPDYLKIGEERLAKVQIRPVVFDKAIKIK